MLSSEQIQAKKVALAEDAKRIKKYREEKFNKDYLFAIKKVTRRRHREWLTIFYTVTGKKPTIKCKGKVIDKNNNMLTVEFEDGSRENLMASAKSIVGDEGIFEMKSNFVVNFQK